MANRPKTATRGARSKRRRRESALRDVVQRINWFENFLSHNPKAERALALLRIANEQRRALLRKLADTYPTIT